MLEGWVFIAVVIVCCHGVSAVLLSVFDLSLSNQIYIFASIMFPCRRYSGTSSSHASICQVWASKSFMRPTYGLCVCSSVTSLAGYLSVAQRIMVCLVISASRKSLHG